MDVMDWHFGGVFEVLPCGQKCVSESGVEQVRLGSCGGNFGKQRFQSRKRGLWQASAIFANGIRGPQYSRARIGGKASDRFGAGDADPHFKIVGLADKNVFLRRKEPKQIAAMNLVFTVREQVQAAALRYEIEFQFGMVMHRISAALLTVMPDIPLQIGRKLEFLAHDDKK